MRFKYDPQMWARLLRHPRVQGASLTEARERATALDREVKAARKAAAGAASEGAKAQAALEAQRAAAGVHQTERREVLEAAAMAQVHGLCLCITEQGVP